MNNPTHSTHVPWKRCFQFSLVTVLFALSMVSAKAQTGLAGAYNFDEGSGPTTRDFSIYNNMGTLSGPSWTTVGKFGGALNFDGFSWVTVNDSLSLDLTTGMTLEAWIFPTAATGNWTNILLKESPPADLAYHLQGDPFNRPSSYITTSVGGLQGVTGPQPLVLNAWTHLASTYDGLTLSLYINGSLVATQVASGTIIPSSGALRLGGNSIWGEYYVGTIDDVRIYNRALTQAEIQSDMNRPVGACVFNPKYWINHPQIWCMETIQIGCASYTPAQALAIMRHNSSQDKTYTLAQQLIAAKLNISCRASSTSCVASAIGPADAWLCAHPVGSGVRANTAAWQAISATNDTLDKYNRGVLCAPICP